MTSNALFFVRVGLLSRSKFPKFEGVICGMTPITPHGRLSILVEAFNSFLRLMLSPSPPWVLIIF